jgi:hypothetical protein
MKTKFRFAILTLILLSVDSYGQTISNTPSYAVNDFALRDKIGQMHQPDSNPQYEGGIEELKKYFSAHSLQDPKAKGIAFRTHIFFIVDSDGKAKNFDLVYRTDPRTPEKKILADLNVEILNIVSQMPQRWLPAQVDGNPVDCYQIISFTIIDGRLDRTVSFR